MKYQALVGALLATITLAAASVASASEIYKWTDEEGNIHYTDTPLGDPSERLDISSKPTNNAAVQNQVQARLDRKAAQAEQLASAPKGPTPEEQRAERKDRAEKCNMYKERMTKYVQSRHLYREDENGERVYLDEAETIAARENVQKQIEEYCNN